MFLRVDDKSQWRELLHKASFKTFFDSLAWQDFLEKEFFWLKFERYTFNDSFLFTVARAKIFGKEKLTSLPFCEYGGSGVINLLWGRDFETLVRSITEYFGKDIRVQFHPYISTPQSGLISLPVYPTLTATLQSGRSSFWIENFSKKSPEHLWRGLRKTLRKEVRNAKGAGMTVAECADEKELRHFYNLYLNTVKRHKNIPLPYSIFQFFRSSLDVRIFIAKRDGRVLGGSIFLFYKPFIHYFINASDYGLRNLSIGHAILWHVMQQYAKGDYDYFDLGGTRKGSALEIFKRGWGANEHQILEMGGRDGPPKDSILRNTWSLLPTHVMERLAPLFLWMKA